MRQKPETLLHALLLTVFYLYLPKVSTQVSKKDTALYKIVGFLMAEMATRTKKNTTQYGR